MYLLYEKTSNIYDNIEKNLKFFEDHFLLHSSAKVETCPNKKLKT